MRYRSGSCFCGDVHYRVGGPPLVVCQCHCTMCQRAVGAAVVTWATFNRKEFETTGPALTWFKSSAAARRAFCQRCGTSLFFESERFPGLIDVTVATLDDAKSLAPSMHLYVGSRQPWQTVRDGLPCHLGDSNSPRVEQS
jgi:hypothetical protein